MSRQMVIRIDDETRERFHQASRREGKTSSEKLRELMDSYLRKADLSQVVDDLWERVGVKAAAAGITEQDGERIVREVRTSR